MNHYDNPEFFTAYAQMYRSQPGLRAPGNGISCSGFSRVCRERMFWISAAAMDGTANMLLSMVHGVLQVLI